MHIHVPCSVRILKITITFLVETLKNILSVPDYNIAIACWKTGQAMLDLDCGMKIIQLTPQAELSFYGQRDEEVDMCRQVNGGCQKAISVNQEHVQYLLEQCEDNSRCSVQMHQIPCNERGNSNNMNYEQLSYICVDKAPSGKDMYNR